MSDLPARLRAARGFAGLTQPELASRIELGQVTYAETERGNRPPPRRELLAIADVTGVPMWFLEGGWENYPGSTAGAGEVHPKPLGHRDLLHPPEDDEDAAESA